MIEKHTKVLVLNVLPRFPLRLDHIVSLFRQIADEHLLHTVRYVYVSDHRLRLLP